jgi:hypothetical protein
MPVGDMTIRNIPDDVFRLFTDKAQQEGLSPESLALRLVQREVRRPKIPSIEDIAELKRLRELTPGRQPSSVPIIRELRDHGDIGD